MNDIISEELSGLMCHNAAAIDDVMIALDGT